jgi:queuine tRNA-ribosyltransferase
LEKRKGKGVAKAALFGIVQGGNYRSLRRESARFVVEQNLPGVAIGGGSVGQNVEETRKNVLWIADLLPEDKPRYLMGVGVNPADLVDAVLVGGDMFDCVAPTRLARMGSLYHARLVVSRGGARVESEYKNGRLSIGKGEFSIKEGRRNQGPILEGCDCFTCSRGYSRGYLHHLFRARELAYYRLASIHNLRFMIRLVKQLREYVVGAGDERREEL